MSRIVPVPLPLPQSLRAGAGPGATGSSQGGPGSAATHGIQSHQSPGSSGSGTPFMYTQRTPSLDYPRLSMGEEASAGASGSGPTGSTGPTGPTGSTGISTTDSSPLGLLTKDDHSRNTTSITAWGSDSAKRSPRSPRDGAEDPEKGLISQNKTGFRNDDTAAAETSYTLPVWWKRYTLRRFLALLLECTLDIYLLSQLKDMPTCCGFEEDKNSKATAIILGTLSVFFAILSASSYYKMIRLGLDVSAIHEASATLFNSAALAFEFALIVTVDDNPALDKGDWIVAAVGATIAFLQELWRTIRRPKHIHRNDHYEEEQLDTCQRNCRTVSFLAMQFAQLAAAFAIFVVTVVIASGVGGQYCFVHSACSGAIIDGSADSVGDWGMCDSSTFNPAISWVSPLDSSMCASFASCTVGCRSYLQAI
jgi:hypothetical protein